MDIYTLDKIFAPSPKMFVLFTIILCLIGIIGVWVRDRKSKKKKEDLLNKKGWYEI